MPTAKKQPSGNYKVRVYSHTDENGRQHYKAFTAATKAEAEQMAAAFAGTADRIERADLTVSEALSGYIKAKEGILSPSTVLNYRRMQKNVFGPIASRKIKKLTTAELQAFVSELSKKHSPKYVRNIYGLLSASLTLYMPEKVFRVKLPTKQKKRVTMNDSGVIVDLFNLASDRLKICIGLAAFSSLRRGEICALKYKDLTGNIIHVHADMIEGVNGWTYKETPKTSDSDRFVQIPEAIVELIGSGDPEEFIVGWLPSTVTKEFIILRNSLNLTIKFHGLRSYYASIGATMVPDVYLASFGGWSKSSQVMKDVYQKEISDLSKVYSDKLTGYFDSLLSGHVLGHESAPAVTEAAKTGDSESV
jgi:integrase